MAELHGVERLAINADGALAALPFDVLLRTPPSATEREAKAYTRYAWLRKTFVISRLSRTARPAGTRQPASRETGGLLGFGNPELAEHVTMMAPALPEANLELALLRMNLHGRPGTIAVGAKASEARFKRALAAADPLAVLALATHGTKVSDQTGDAVLMLSHGNGEDGLLTAEEVRALRFRADLVILSACDSGAETLVDAFIEAGGDQVLALRWPVLSDVARQVSSTVVAMTQNDADLPHDLALWQALDQLISGGASPHLGHPVIWAPFVLTTATA
jgi:CHAT domain-containing protein